MSRRGNSEGSITRRSDGRWMARLSLPDGRRKAFYGRTRQAVLKKLREAQRAKEEGLPVAPERLTVGAWLKTWLQDSAAHKVRAKTLHRYKEIIDLHLVPRLGHIRLKSLTATDVQRAFNQAIESGQSPKSVVQHRAVLRSALNSAIKNGLIARNAAALADAPHVPEREYEALTPERAHKVVAAVKGDRLEALYILFLATGLRASEALGLRWADANLDAGTAAIQRTLQRIDGEWQFLEPKTKRSRRTVPLPAQVVQALKEHRARQLEERLRLGPAWQGERWGELVFTNELGGPLGVDTALHHFQRLLTRAGLPVMRLHDLRHGAASLWAALGVTPRVAMELLGHSQISTTMNIYTHVTADLQREAMDRMGALLEASP